MGALPCGSTEPCPPPARQPPDRITVTWLYTWSGHETGRGGSSDPLLPTVCGDHPPLQTEAPEGGVRVEFIFVIPESSAVAAAAHIH